MKIVAVNSYLKHLPLKKPYTIAYKTITDVEIVFFEIVLENGIAGAGAANPSADVAGETSEDAFSNLQSPFLHELVGKDIRNINSLIDTFAGHFKNSPGTLAAIDIALHDAFCRFLQIPVVDFYGRKIDSLPTSVTVGIKDTPAMIEEAQGYYLAGFRILKIKTGINVDEDIERVFKLFENFKKDVIIRVDANLGYTATDLKKFIRQTKQLNIELIEQPLKVGEEDQLLLFEEDVRKRFVADESLLDASSAMKLVESAKPYGVFNIKLMKCGGIKAAKEIATIAKHAGIELFWGCNDESVISITAALHAAFSCSNTKYLDLDGSFDISRDIVEGGFTIDRGFMKPTGLPGLGIRKAE